MSDTPAQHAEYVRQLEDALLVLWDELTEEESLRLKADCPDLTNFIVEVRTRWWGAHNDGPGGVDANG